MICLQDLEVLHRLLFREAEISFPELVTLSEAVELLVELQVDVVEQSPNLLNNNVTL